MVESPCTRQCRIDVTENVCRGCSRTLAEIQEWSTYTDEQKQMIIDKIMNINNIGINYERL